MDTTLTSLRAKVAELPTEDQEQFARELEDTLLPAPTPFRGR